MDTESTEDKRIKIKRDDLCIVPCNNLVLCKVQVVDGFDPKSGLYKGSKTWDEAGNCTVFGEVVVLPRKLSFRDRPGKSGMEWKTTLEAQVGDIAYWGIMEGANCPVLTVGDQTYYLVDYGEIRLLKREEKIIPVNGFVILEEVVKKQDGIIITPDSAIHTDKKRGIVRYIGNRNECYYPETELCDPIDIKVGDEVLFKSDILTPLEDSRYAGIKEKVWYCQGRWIIATAPK
jgi:co-chaperonin GroES (HSP10)